MSCGNNSLYGPSDKYIKFLNGDLVAIEGSNTVDKQILNTLRIPYSQLLRGRITLKAGQTDYLMNHLGMGDNATLLSIAATYDPNSKIEEDNYVKWSYATDLSRFYYFDQLMILTGNSTHRIPQLYLTNPNQTYNVILDVMVANIDDTYNYFNDTINQYGYSFVNLLVSCIRTHVVNESIVINDNSGNPLLFMRLANINSIEKTGLVLIIDDSSYGTVFLKFSTQYDTDQAHSLLNYVLKNANVNINLMNPVTDDIVPIVYFNSKVGNTGDYIAFNGATAGVPYDTSYGGSFSTSISLGTYGTASGTYSVIDSNLLVNLLIHGVNDNRDGTMSVTGASILINGTQSIISATGSYTMAFNLSDIAQNYVAASVALTITN
jgi:hypothetical protein